MTALNRLNVIMTRTLAVACVALALFWPGWRAELQGLGYEECSASTVTPPAFFSLRAHMWSMGVDVSANEGLVLRDVMLGTRYMARKMSLPYYTLETSSPALSVRGELKPNSSDANARSRLVSFSNQVDADKLVIEASYVIDSIPPGSDSCLVVTQRHEFYKTFWPDMKSISFDDPCEPSEKAPISRGQLACARFKPIVKYQFIGAEGETLSRIELPQRFHFQVDQKSPNTAALTRDIDSGIPPIEVSANPLLQETVASVITGGTQGEFDNYHQTYKERVDLPVPFPPGCPECVHMHWRWAKFLDFPDGNPIIPKGSDQDVQIGIIKWRNSEMRPIGMWQALVDQESLKGEDLVFWYSGISGGDKRADDQFFIHGGFFQPAVKVTARQFRPNVNIDGFTLKITISNTSESPIAGPVSLVLDGLNSSLSLPSGVTKSVAPFGFPYVNIDVGSDNVLSAREEASVFLDFPNSGFPHDNNIRFTPRVLTGPGAR